MRPLRTARLVGAVALAATLLPGGLRAQRSDGDGWSFSVTPWVWLMNTEGVLGVADRDLELDLSPGEMFDLSRWSMSVHMEAQRGDLFLFADPVYQDLTLDAPVSTPEGPATGRVSLELLAVDVGAGYRVARPVQVVAGARFLGTSLEARIDEAPQQTYPADSDLWNVFIGARVLERVSERWGILLHGDVGFGQSDANYALQGAIQFRPFEPLGLDLGYRWFHDEAEQDDATLRTVDLDRYGVALGISFLF